ncbi:MAG: prolyl-tRNA synthetase associated domain-containing protein [Proteobacteria bacterium]|nr:prolyl-tRNA synthetase associated domain-containing protein [Pseudomonadota bacterium]MBI3497382.1 prolyl-tRNA synthetase associated domain-containing protein [Pseudomonadota bacterium]
MPDAASPPLPVTPAALFRRLKELGIETRTHSHPPLMTVEDSKRLRGDLPGGHCKNLFLKDRKDQMWLVVTLEDRPVDIKSLEKKLGSARLSFASPERLLANLGVTPGAVTPFALINDREGRVQVVLDEAMLAFDPLNYHPLTNEQTTQIAPGDLIRFLEACGHRPQILNLDL